MTSKTFPVLVIDFAAAGDRDVVAARFEAEERAHSEKGVAADFFSAFDGFEEEGVGLIFSDGKEGGDRSEQIGGDRLRHRD